MLKVQTNKEIYAPLAKAFGVENALIEKFTLVLEPGELPTAYLVLCAQHPLEIEEQDQYEAAMQRVKGFIECTAMSAAAEVTEDFDIIGAKCAEAERQYLTTYAKVYRELKDIQYKIWGYKCWY